MRVAAVATAASSVWALAPAARAQQPGSFAAVHPPSSRVTGVRLDFRPVVDASCPTEAAFRADVAGLFNQQGDVFDPAGATVVRVTTGRDAQTGRYEGNMELVRADGTVHPSTPVRYEALTCWLVLRQVAVAAAAYFPTQAEGAVGGTAGAAGAAVADADAPACDAACVEERIRVAVEKVRREAYERGRLDGRNEREAEIEEHIDAAIDRRLAKRGLPPSWPPEQPGGMTLPFAVSVGGLVSIGYALDVAPGFVVGAEWRPAEMFSLGVEARAVLPAPTFKFGSAASQVSLYSALVAPCFRYKVLVGCAAFDAGAALHSEPKEDGDTWEPHLALGPRIGLDIPFTEAFAVRVLGDLLFPLTGVAITYSNDEGKKLGEYITPTVSGFVSAGVAVSF